MQERMPRMSGRKKLTRVPEVERSINQNLEDVINRLYDETALGGVKKINQQEIRIQKNISPKALELVAQLPFEVLLSEHDAGTTLLTGTKNNIWTDPKEHANMRTKRQARYTLHNHPGTLVTTSSYGDTDVSRMSLSEIDFIVSREGILLHKPTYDDGLSDVDRQMSFGRWIAGKRGPSHRLRHDIKKGYVKAWIPWTEKEKIQLICDYMNSEKSWDEYKAAVMGENA